MRKALNIYIIALLAGISAFAQLRETVYVHANSDQLIVGETLNFAGYCRNPATGQLSGMSKILYVELVGKDGPVFQQKIALEEGKGSGSYFLSSLLSTGRYQLIAYTRWMKNFGDYFQVPVTIINPYEEYKPVKQDKDLLVEVFPANKLIPDLPTKIAFKISQAGKPLESNAKVTDQSGDFSISISSDKNGFGSFELTPELGESYQIIAEDISGAFVYFDLPKLSPEGAVINLETTDYNLVASIQSNIPSNVGFLVIRNQDGVLVEKEILFGNKQLISKKELGDTPFLIEVFDSKQKLLASRSYTFDIGAPELTSIDSNFETRSEANISANLTPGHYSVSIRKKFDDSHINQSNTLTAGLQQFIITPAAPYQLVQSKDPMDLSTFLLGSKTNSDYFTKKEHSMQFLPEVREELISGQLIKSAGQKQKDLISLSIPGDQFQIRFAETDEDGYFTLPFASPATATEAFIYAPFVDSSYTISIEESFLTEYPEFDYTAQTLDSTAIKAIIDRSVRNQLQNAFHPELAEGTAYQNWLPQIPFNHTYILDEYTRFQTLKETFVEFIPSVTVRDSKDQKIKPILNHTLKSNYPPLILLDGVPVKEDGILEYSPYKVERIEILDNRYFLGPLTANGVINFVTKDDSFEKYPFDERYIRTPISGINKASLKNLQTVEEENIPDKRDQLYWDAHLQVEEEGTQQIKFITSDVTGYFEMVIEGYTNTGKPISIIKSFVVVEKQGL